MNTPPPAAPKAVPEPTLRRLPLYHRYLKELAEKGRESISCPEIGHHLKLDSTQIRKDFETAGIVGRPRVGYVLADVVEGIEQFLGWNNLHEAFLVGAGSMGVALLGYKRFEQYGLNIVAAFDSDAAKIGTELHGKQVLPINQLIELARRMHILIGIITVPARNAQTVAELMVRGGIRAIWNFAPVRVRVPDHVVLHNEDLYCSLASLSQKLAKNLQAHRTTVGTGTAGPAVASGQTADPVTPATSTITL
jgi:redox-sensing transcriptional repressor